MCIVCLDSSLIIIGKCTPFFDLFRKKIVKLNSKLVSLISLEEELKSFIE